MNRLLYISDDEVESQLATKCNLIVHAGLESLQYAVIDTVRDQVKVLAEYTLSGIKTVDDLIAAIENLPESSKQFKYSFNKVKVSFDTFNYTFIPAELYLPADQEAYTKFLKPAKNSDILVNHIRSADIKNVAVIESRFNFALNRIFQKPKIYNQANPFLEGIKKIVTTDSETSLFIDVHASHIQAAFLKNSKLEFYNIFEYSNIDEFNYYILNIIESLVIDIQKTAVILSGKISENDDHYKRIQKYFDNISFADSNQLVKYPERFEEVLAHTYFPLISLDLCE